MRGRIGYTVRSRNQPECRITVQVGNVRVGARNIFDARAIRPQLIQGAVNLSRGKETHHTSE